MDFNRYDPIRVFETKTGVCQIYCAAIALTVANNTAVVAAVSGKRIRVMGWNAQTQNAAAGTYLFKSASGGTTLYPTTYAPPLTSGAMHQMPIAQSGYFETNTGEGLYADCTTQVVTVAVFYITYTP